MIRVYLDACCLNRPFDDQTQVRIRLESEAVLMVVTLCESGRWRWVGSEVIDTEVARTPDAERRRRVHSLASRAHERIEVSSPERNRALQLQENGFSPYDALHIACAEAAGVTVLLTTDDALIKRATAQPGLQVRVVIPLVWLREVYAA